MATLPFNPGGHVPSPFKYTYPPSVGEMKLSLSLKEENFYYINKVSHSVLLMFTNTDGVLAVEASTEMFSWNHEISHYPDVGGWYSATPSGIVTADFACAVRETKLVTPGS